jgi:signal transduction histidine kinase
MNPQREPRTGPDRSILPLTSRPLPPRARDGEADERAWPGTVHPAVGGEDAVRRLAGASAHTLNNLLTVIQGSASLLVSEVRDPDFLLDLDEILDACERATAFTDRLLALAGARWRNPRTVELRSFLVEQRPRRRLPGNVLFCEELPAQPCPVLVDPEGLEETLDALLTNAEEAVDGRGSIRVSLEPALLPPEREGTEHAWVRLEVADDGHGMDEATASRALDPFFTTRGNASGRGLGLSLAFAFVRASGGTLRFRTAPGRGTRVRLRLPAAPTLKAASSPGS